MNSNAEDPTTPKIRLKEERIKRRSSIFKPEDSEPSTLGSKLLVLPEDYINKLNEEITQWQEAFNKFSTEVKNLKHIKDEYNSLQPVQDNFIFDHYLIEANKAFLKLDTLVEKCDILRKSVNTKKESFTKFN